MIAALKKILPEERIKTRYIDVISFAADAGFYQLIPRAVVKPVNEEEIVALFRFSQAHAVPLVFRSGGTSLSGQSVTDGILVDLSQHWNKINIENAGAIVPENAGCCGMAGDRGFLFPALTAAATAPEAKEVNQQSYNGYYSSTKTCEMAMSEAVKENYESILYLVDDAL